MSTSIQVTKKVKYSTLFLNKNYLSVLISQLLSDLGDGVYALGLIWTMKKLTGSASQMSLVLIAEVLPLILVGTFAGVIVDRGNKKYLMLVSDFIRGSLMIVLSIMSMRQLLQPWMLVVSAVILSTFSSFFSPARTVTVRTVVAENSIMQAQGIAQSIQAIVGLIGPAIAAILIASNASFTFLANAVSFFASFIFLLFLRHKELRSKIDSKMSAGSVLVDIKAGFRVISDTAILKNLICYLVVLNFLTAPVTILFPLYAESSTQLASFETLFFVGILIGSLTVGLFGRTKKIIPITLGILLMNIGFAILGLQHYFPIALVSMFCVGLGLIFTNVPLNSIFITEVPKDILGRVSSTMSILAQLAKPISLSLTGAVLIYVAVHSFFIGIALLGLTTLFAMIMNPVIRRN